MTEIEKVKAQIKVLEKKLSFLEELEQTKSPVEEAYKKVYGVYPTNEITYNSMWGVFQKGYYAAQEDYKVGEYQEPKEQKWDVVRESVKWCEEHPDENPLDWLSPKTPEETAQSLKEAFKEAQQTEKWKEIQKLIDEEDNDKNFKNSLDLIREWGEKNKPKTLTDIIWVWWTDVFTTNEEWDAENVIEDLVDRIELFLPKEQSAKGSQNAYVECSVEGFNDAIKKIKGKLR